MRGIVELNVCVPEYVGARDSLVWIRVWMTRRIEDTEAHRCEDTDTQQLFWLLIADSFQRSG
jgi:hypothetical protein